MQHPAVCKRGLVLVRRLLRNFPKRMGLEIDYTSLNSDWRRVLWRSA